MNELSNASPSLRLFDCNTRVGYMKEPPPAPILTAPELLAEMDRCGVDKALVHSTNVELMSAIDANIAVSELCTGQERLQPVWSILPPQTGEMVPDRLLDDMKRQGVRILRAYPAENHYLLNSLTLGPLLDKLCDHQIPLFVPGQWADLTQLLQDFPQLIVIAADYGCWGQDRLYRPLIERYEHFHIETSALELDGGIPRLVADYGSERVLFGSGCQSRSMGGASLLLRNLDIDPVSKALIAHGNLERLLLGTRL
ncbi:MAG: hypothetical protein PHR35_18755 [Kiritimatiellae bacterium]|nr:hypothetical protein [Kiritimatiellia bacterium]